MLIKFQYFLCFMKIDPSYLLLWFRSKLFVIPRINNFPDIQPASSSIQVSNPLHIYPAIDQKNPKP